MTKHKVLSFAFAVLVCVFRLLLLVVTPLYLDCLNPVHTELYNISSYRESTPPAINSTLIINDVPIDNTTTPVWQRIDPFFGIWISMGFDTLLFGVILLVLYLCVPGQITERERNYPKKVFLQAGACQAVSALLYQFSSSGKRIAPYLQGPLNYFLIPETFVLRFLILRKKPTLRKLLCAVVVFFGEIICLLPVIFPWLETDTEKAEEGGATGIGRILWPIVFIVQMIPHALWNILLEKGAKDKTGSGANIDQRQLHMVYVLFWNFFATFFTTLCLFWIDFIPGFGLMPNIDLFFPQLWFNIKCIFGAADVCGSYQLFTAWSRMFTKTALFISIGLLLRYGEGASLYAILVSIVSPALFVVFSLFDEQAVRYEPHITLSTWLSVGALAVMLPTVIVYNTGPPEVTVEVENNVSGQENEDQEQLLDDENTSSVPSEPTGSINPTV